MNAWTPSQRDAIETKNTDLLVSAGAGSGKTSVLTERLVRRITEGGDIGRMLVATFICAISFTVCRTRACAPCIPSAWK